VDNDMIARRTEHLSPAGHDLLAELRDVAKAGDYGATDALAERFADLPPSDQREVWQIAILSRHAAGAEQARIEETRGAATKAEQGLLAARENLQNEGTPAGPHRTVGEIYEVLRNDLS
jgi:hypothetical protein